MMKENTKNILKYLQANANKQLTAEDVAKAMGFEKKATVDGAFTSFVKKGWGTRVAAEETLPDGTHKPIKFLVLTAAGKVVDPDATTDAE